MADDLLSYTTQAMHDDAMTVTILTNRSAAQAGGLKVTEKCACPRDICDFRDVK